jgi:hypothetical protein
MKIGDLIICRGGGGWDIVGVLLYDNAEYGTLKIYSTKAETLLKTVWVVKSECEVLSESQ